MLVVRLAESFSRAYRASLAPLENENIASGASRAHRFSVRLCFHCHTRANRLIMNLLPTCLFIFGFAILARLSRTRAPVHKAIHNVHIYLVYSY